MVKSGNSDMPNYDVISILGSDYAIYKLSYHESEFFKLNDRDGWCDPYSKEIVYCDILTNPNWRNELETSKKEYERRVLKHEIIHAFIYESGVGYSSHSVERWGKDEEIVDWIVTHSSKIFDVFKKLDLL